MTTPQWTIDENDELRYGGVKAFLLDDLDDDRYDALVADVAAARLVDDMAAVIRRLTDGWDIVEDIDGRPTGWYLESGMDDIDISGEEPMSPGEVAALHHARQQEGS